LPINARIARGCIGGNIADENRKSQAEFECALCGYKTNADFNAARNIALLDIEKRIKGEIERLQDEWQAKERAIELITE